MGITRRRFLGSVAAGAVAAGLGTGVRGQGVGGAKRKMNVLFLMADDMRVELGCYASRFGARTPHLDALARSGVRFDRNYCQFPLCNPSRSSLLTGRPATVTGVLGNRTAFRDVHPEWTTLPELFRQNGYVALRSGKIFHGGLDDAKSWDIAGGPANEEAGNSAPSARVMRFENGVATTEPADAAGVRPKTKAAYSDRILLLEGNGEGHGDYKAADRAIGWLNTYKNEPFFLACGMVKPHSPPTAPQRFFDMYDAGKIKLPPDFAAWPTVPGGFPAAAIRKRNADLFIGRAASEGEAREVIRAYIASISWADWNLGRVLGELDRLGLRENTIVVYVVDHGSQLGETGKGSKAGSLFEMGTRVPLMISAPGMRGNGKACYRIVESLDVYRTVAELAGLEVPAGVEGESLVPLLRDPGAAWEKPAYSVWSEDGKTLHGVAVRTEKWRYAEYGLGGKNGAMLLDPGDPDELKNVAGESSHAGVVAELSALTRKYAARLAT
ncbi:MAG: sulfatase [Phycisphaerae bacterium]